MLPIRFETQCIVEKRTGANIQDGYYNRLNLEMLMYLHHYISPEMCLMLLNYFAPI